MELGSKSVLSGMDGAALGSKSVGISALTSGMDVVGCSAGALNSRGCSGAGSVGSGDAG